MLLAGKDIKVVSYLMGHASTSFTADTYQHITRSLVEGGAGVISDSMKEAANRIARDQTVTNWRFSLIEHVLEKNYIPKILDFSGFLRHNTRWE
jgi:ferritin-like protein